MTNEWVMQILGQPGIGVEAEGDLWLADFDLEAFDGFGRAEMTEDIAEAMRFDSPGDVLDTWYMQSVTCPIRPDGKPNRPLTALSIMPVKVDS